MSPRLVDELRRMKDGGVPWDRAWACCAGINPGKHFCPSDTDDGTQLPGPQEDIEPMCRFLYRVLRDCYLDIGTPWRVALDAADEPLDFTGMIGARRAA